MLLKGNLRYADDVPHAWLGYTVQAAYLLPRTALFEESATLSENKEKTPPQTTASANSAAFQDSVRNSAMNAVQKLRDSTMQSASAVRRQRNSTIQRVVQTENVAAHTKVIGNHNHCHSMNFTIFEILKHERVTTEYVSAQECLFVPMWMNPFDAAIVYRYADILKRVCKLPFAHPARRGFEAVERLQGNIIEPTTYPDIATETVTQLTGTMQVHFAFNRPTDETYIETRQVRDTSGNSNTPPLITISITHYRYKAENWAEYIALIGTDYNMSNIESTINNFETAAQRNAFFYNTLAPIIAKKLLKKLKLTVKNNGTAIADLQTEWELVSPYQNGQNLTAELRLLRTGFTPALFTFGAVSFELAVSDVAWTLNELLGTASVKTVSLKAQTLNYAERQIVLAENVNYGIKSAAAACVLAKISAPAPVAGTPTSPIEQDKALLNALIQHLDAHIEYYHRAIWLGCDAMRLTNILDSVLAPLDQNELDKWHLDNKNKAAADWTPLPTSRSVAQVCEHTIVAVVGNCLVLPVAQGYRLDPSYKVAKNTSLYDAFYPTGMPQTPLTITLPTRGTFAEAIPGGCNLCEKIEDDRAQDWTVFTTDEPTAINPLDTGSRYQNPGNLQTKDLAAPIVNIQNAPAAPDPQGLQALANLLGKPDLFKDMTGLEGTQNLANNAMIANTIAQQARIKAATDAMNALDKMYEKGQITKQQRDDKRNEVADTFTPKISEAVADVDGKMSDYFPSRENLNDFNNAGVKTIKTDGKGGVEIEMVGDGNVGMQEYPAKAKIKHGGADVILKGKTSTKKKINGENRTLISINEVEVRTKIYFYSEDPTIDLRQSALLITAQINSEYNFVDTGSANCVRPVMTLNANTEQEGEQTVPIRFNIIPDIIEHITANTSPTDTINNIAVQCKKEGINAVFIYLHKIPGAFDFNTGTTAPSVSWSNGCVGAWSLLEDSTFGGTKRNVYAHEFGHLLGWLRIKDMSEVEAEATHEPPTSNIPSIMGNRIDRRVMQRDINNLNFQCGLTGSTKVSYINNFYMDIIKDDPFFFTDAEPTQTIGIDRKWVYLNATNFMQEKDVDAKQP